MKGLDLIERDRASPIEPVSGRGPLVIEGILRFTGDGADERERGLVLAPRRVSKVNLRGGSMIGNHAAEQVGRYTADKPRRCAETRDADGDVEAGASNRSYDGVASIRRFEGQEIDQGVTATQQHVSNSLCWDRRSLRSRASRHG